MQLSADSILINANIYTQNEAQPWAEAVAILHGQIIAVGSGEEMTGLTGPRTRVIDCGGRLMLPGLCDAHIHFFDWSMGRQRVMLEHARSKSEMLELIQARAEETPADAWILGQGWNESRWGVSDFPDRHDLDPVTGERPAIFHRSDMHAAVVNSAALGMAGIRAETPNPPGGVIDRDSQGEPTGVLRELAMGLVVDRIPPVTPEEVDRAFVAGMAELHRYGITAIHDQRIKGVYEGPIAIAAYQRLRRAGQLKLRVNTNIAAHDLDHLAGLGLSSGLGDDRLRLGFVKLFCDGSLGSRTAWMLEPFEKERPNEPENWGVNVTPVEQMAAEFRRAVSLGFPISVHAIGDRANREVLNIFEGMAQEGLTTAIPHRIEHVQTIHRDDVPRLAALGLTASVQTIHALEDMDTANLYLGQRTANTYAFKWLHDAGTRLAIGSDAPVAPPNPFHGIHAALTRRRMGQPGASSWHPEQRLDLETTLRGYTLSAAEASGWQQTIGSIEPGKRADLVVVDRDIFKLAEAGAPGDELAETQVVMTIFDGEVVWG